MKQRSSVEEKTLFSRFLPCKKNPLYIIYIKRGMAVKFAIPPFYKIIYRARTAKFSEKLGVEKI